MLLIRKNLIVALIFLALTQQPAYPTTAQLQGSTSLPSRMARIMTAWLCIPEQQLSPLNYAKNSLPWMGLKAHKWGTKAFENKYGLRGQKLMPQYIYFFGSLYVLDALLEKILDATAIAKSHPLKGFGLGNRKMNLKMALAILKNYASSEKTSRNPYSSPLYFAEAGRILHGLNGRRALLNLVQKRISVIHSRSVPASMHGKKYIVVENPFGFAIRNAPALIKAFSCLTLAATYILEYIKTEPRTDGAATPGSSSSLPGFMAQLIRELYSISMYIDPLLEKTTNTTKQPWVKIACQLPWATHCYILESELAKLATTAQAELYQLASEDAFDAIETINNAFLVANKELNKRKQNPNPRGNGQPNSAPQTPVTQPTPPPAQKKLFPGAGRSTGDSESKEEKRLREERAAAATFLPFKARENQLEKVERISCSATIENLDRKQALQITLGTKGSTTAYAAKCSKCGIFHREGSNVGWNVLVELREPAHARVDISELLKKRDRGLPK